MMILSEYIDIHLDLDTSTHCLYTKHCLDNCMLTPLYTFYIMVLKGMFLYEIRRCTPTYVVTLRCKQFSDWLTHYVDK